MPSTRKQKEQNVSRMETSISEAASVVFATFNGLTVKEIGELRDNLAVQKCYFKVVPKRLLKIAIASSKLDFDPVATEGQIAVIWGPDTVTPAKTVNDFATGRENIKLVAGALEGASLSTEQVNALAILPSRDQLLGQLLSVISGPARGLVQGLSGVPRNLVYALQAIKDQKAESN